MHINLMGTHRSAQKCTRKTNNVQQRPSKMPDKRTNESLDMILIIKAELINKAHLPFSVIVDVVIFLCCFYYGRDCLTKSSITIF